MQKKIRSGCLLTLGVLSCTALSAQDLEKQAATLKVIRETAADICMTVSLEGSGESTELSGNAKAKVKGAVSKVVDLGVEGAAKYQSASYINVLQSDLVSAIKHGNDCKKDVFNALVDRMLPALGKEGGSGGSSQRETNHEVKPGERVHQSIQLAKSAVFDANVTVGVYRYIAGSWPRAVLTIDGKPVGWQSPGFKRLAKTTQTKRCFVEYAEAPDQSTVASKAVFRFEYSCESV